MVYSATNKMDYRYQGQNYELMTDEEGDIQDLVDEPEEEES